MQEIKKPCRPKLFQNIMMSQAAIILSGFYMRSVLVFVHPMHCLDNLCYTGQMYFKFIFIAQSIPQKVPPFIHVAIEHIVSESRLIIRII